MYVRESGRWRKGRRESRQNMLLLFTQQIIGLKLLGFLVTDDTRLMRFTNKHAHTHMFNVHTYKHEVKTEKIEGGKNAYTHNHYTLQVNWKTEKFKNVKSKMRQRYGRNRKTFHWLATKKIQWIFFPILLDQMSITHAHTHSSWFTIVNTKWKKLGIGKESGK